MNSDIVALISRPSHTHSTIFKGASGALGMASLFSSTPPFKFHRISASVTSKAKDVPAAIKKREIVPRFHWLLLTFFSRMKTGYFDRDSSIRRVSSTKESFRDRERRQCRGGGGRRSCCEAVKGTVLDTGKTCLLLWRIVRDIVFHFTFMYISGSRCLIQCWERRAASPPRKPLWILTLYRLGGGRKLIRLREILGKTSLRAFVFCMAST